MTDIKDAVLEVTEAIKADPDLYIAYQANIAMAFYDEAHKYKKSIETDIGDYEMIEFNDLHELANNAAKRFLDLWCSRP